MRHLRISGQNIKSLTTFKSQIGGILRQLNKFNDNEKTEAISYVKTFIEKDPEASCSTTTILPKKKKRKVALKARNNSKLIKKKVPHTKNDSVNKSKKVKYSDPKTVASSKITFKCKVCNVTEKRKRDMLRHVETHVGSPRSCIKCRRTFNGSIPFNWHLTHYCKSLIYRNWKFKCNQCPQEFVTKRTLESHLQGHKRNNCSYCDKVLTRRVQLIRHLLEVHSIKMERDTYNCSYCGKKYIKKCTLYYHIRQHVPNKFVCLECGKIDETVEESEEHRKLHDVKKHFNCVKCGEKFSRRQQYLYHLKRHNRYKCITCNESYASRAKVTQHKQQGHQVEGLNPRFICPHCPTAFHRENKFHIHMRKHTGESRNINCKYCKKSFNSHYAYYKHCITISHEKFSPEISDIVCEKCGKNFIKKYDLKQHMYRVHNEFREILKCQYCNYKTSHKCNMERHVALHFRKSKQFTCEHCGKSCDSIASLKDHIAYNHIQEKQFKCEKCNKCFKRNSELIRHQDSHSDQRPHVCTICAKSYKRLNHLKRHEKSAHKIVKESRRIKKIAASDEETVDSVTEKNSLPANKNKVIIIQSHINLSAENKYILSRAENEGMLLNFAEAQDINNSSNIVEQLVSSYLPEKGWGLDNEELYSVYNDVALNYENQQLPEINESEI